MSKASEIVRMKRLAEGREPLWIVGHLLDNDGRWSFQGAFTDEQLAADACINAEFFIAPAMLNESLPAADGQWPGLYFPKLGKVTA